MRRPRKQPTVVWEHETPEQRVARRYALCQLDGLLGDIEHHMMRGGGPLPPRIRIHFLACERDHVLRGGAPVRHRVGPYSDARDYLDLTFEMQEWYRRHLIALGDWVRSLPQLLPPEDDDPFSGQPWYEIS